MGALFHFCGSASPGGTCSSVYSWEEFCWKRRRLHDSRRQHFLGHGLKESLEKASADEDGATVFGYWVKDPERYGVVTYDGGARVLGIEEKPSRPKSNWAVAGLYFYDNLVLEIAAGLKPSARGELEITDVNAEYLSMGSLRIERLGRGIAWLDTGTHEALMQAGSFIQTIEQRQGLRIACVEEIAYSMGYIDAEQLEKLAKPVINSGYGRYLLGLLRQGGQEAAKSIGRGY